MTTTSEAYLTLLEQVERALDEALDTGKVPEGHRQHEELLSMRHEVAAVRRAMLQRESTSGTKRVATAQQAAYS